MKLNGYRASHRNKWLLIQKGILSQQEFCLFEFYVDSYDFDPRHDRFGTFEVNFKETAIFFNVGKSSVYKWHSKLLLLGLIKPTGDKKIFTLPNFARYIISKFNKGEAENFAKEEKNQSFEVIFYHLGLNFHEDKNKFQLAGKDKDNSASESITKGLVSSKVDNLFIPIIRTREEYSHIKKEMDFKLLTEEDMEWIDTNVRENIVGTG